MKKLNSRTHSEGNTLEIRVFEGAHEAPQVFMRPISFFPQIVDIFYACLARMQARMNLSALPPNKYVEFTLHKGALFLSAF